MRVKIRLPWLTELYFKNSVFEHVWPPQETVFSSFPKSLANEWGERATTLNIPISEGVTNSRHMHNLDKSQSHRGLKLLLSDSNFMTTVNIMIINYKFKKISVWLWIVRATCLSMNNAKSKYFKWLVLKANTLVNNAKCQYFHAKWWYFHTKWQWFKSILVSSVEINNVA